MILVVVEMIGEETVLSTRLILHVVGGISLETADGRPIDLPNKKARAILAYLALSQNPYETRERIAGLFWSDSGEEQARASLRQCIKQLRDRLNKVDFTSLQAGSQEISLDPAAVNVDLLDIGDDLSRGKLHTLLSDVAVLSEQILYGYETLDRSFAAWLHVIRQNWHDRLIARVQSVMRDRSSPADLAVEAAGALVKLDSTHEEAQRHLIRHHADSGNTAAAIRQYNGLWDHLDREFDMEPDGETQTLIAQIKAGTYEAAPTPASGGVVAPESTPAGEAFQAIENLLKDLPVIGISSFTQGGPWTAELYLIEGFRRELTASLVRFREWVVVESDSPLAAQLGGANRPRLDYQLDGMYFEEQATVQIIVTLKDCATSQYIWSEKLTLSLDNWIDARQKIIQRISMALNVYLSTRRLNLIATRPDVPTDLYDRWLRAQQLCFQWRPDAREQAASMFRVIIEDAPDFAPAYSSLVQTYNTHHLVFPGVFRSPGREREALLLAKRAVQLDPLNTHTQLCLAWSHAMNGQYEQAAFSYRLAKDLNESDPWTLISSALGLAFCGDVDDACLLAEQALDLDRDPSVSHWGYHATIRFICKDYEGTVEAVDRAENAIYNMPAWKAAALVLIGRVDEARETASKLLETLHRNWHGDKQPTDADIGRWLIHGFPFGDKETRERLVGGLIAAGVPARED